MSDQSPQEKRDRSYDELREMLGVNIGLSRRTEDLQQDLLIILVALAFGGLVLAMVAVVLWPELLFLLD